MTRYGFTGSQLGFRISIISKLISSLNLTDDDVIITGACIGIDSQVSHYIKKHYPNVQQLIIVPSNLSRVDKSVFINGKVRFMPVNTGYRKRNEAIVDESDKVIAFWSGKKIYSGTYMTMNIAKKQNKLYEVVRK